MDPALDPEDVPPARLSHTGQEEEDRLPGEDEEVASPYQRGSRSRSRSHTPTELCVGSICSRSRAPTEHDDDAPEGTSPSNVAERPTLGVALELRHFARLFQDRVDGMAAGTGIVHEELPHACINQGQQRQTPDGLCEVCTLLYQAWEKMKRLHPDSVQLHALTTLAQTLNDFLDIVETRQGPS